MLVKQEQISPCEVELEFEIAADAVASEFDDTYAELGKKVTVPGFRKGKAPREVLRSFLDKEEVRLQVADKLIERAYREALNETKLEPFRAADVRLLQFELGSPMLFKIKVPLAPKVELGEYIGLEVERRVPPVTEEDVMEEIRQLIDQRTPFEPVTGRELREGDVARVTLKREDQPDEEPAEHTVKVGENLPDFDRGLVGMRIGEQKAIQVTYPADYEDEELRGRTISILATLQEIHSKQLPELTDEWVKQTFAPEPREGEESNPDSVIDTVEKLKDTIRRALERASQAYADEMVRLQIVDKVISGSTVCFPEVIVEEAVDSRLEEIQDSLKERRVTLDDYLRQTKQTLDAVRERIAEDFRKALTANLVFREIMKRENITVGEEDIKAEIGEMARERGVPVLTMTAYVESTGSEDAVAARVRRKKVVDFLVHASNIKNVVG